MPLESLISDGWQVHVYYFNPNIHPYGEYIRRLDVLEPYLLALESELVTLEPYQKGLVTGVRRGPYEEGIWEEKVGVMGGPYPLIEGAEDYLQNESAKRERCRACYELRFNSLAEYAVEIDCDYIDSTLSISPYQFTQEIQEALQEAAKEQDRKVLQSDWSEDYQQSVQRSRALGMYRQNYCGCRYSLQEAELERQARRVKK